MTSPFERDPDVEAALRASLDAHARQAPTGDGLVEQIVTAAASGIAPPARRIHRSWGRFTLPAAAAILAAIVGITIAIVAANPDEHPNPPVAQTTAPIPTVTVTRTPPASPAPTTATTSPTVDTSALHDVRVIDLTFTTEDDGWALASARCILNPGARCTAFMHTTDGVSWPSRNGPAVSVAGIGTACPCAEHIRFATDTIGYVYGPDVFWMTTDGGANWQQQKGGALALETADQNVVRLERSSTGLRLTTAPLGATTWTPRSLGTPDDDSVTDGQLTRSGQDVYVLATSGLYRSGDDGATWSAAAQPCAQAGGAPYSLAAGTRGRVALTCERGPQPSTAAQLVTSTDTGRSFVPRGTLPQVGGLLAVGPADAYLLALDRLSRTADSGAHWQTVPDVAAPFVWLGFESDDVGRVVADNGTTIWTTRNGGATWTKKALP